MSEGVPTPPALIERPPRGLSLRTRLVLLTTAGLAIGLALGVVALTTALRSSLERTSDQAALQTARDVGALIDADRLPNPIPVGGTTMVQVLDSRGGVLAASAGVDRLVALLRPDEVSTVIAKPGSVPGSRFGVDGPVRVVALRAGPATAPATVIVGAPAVDIDNAVGVVRIALIAGFGALLAILAAVTWRIVGATLRPVELLRTGAEMITGTGSADTLALPSTHDEIHRLAKTLNGMLIRLEAARRRQRSFVADAAHELRSPLASLRTQLEVAAATGDTPDAADLLAEIDRLTALVLDLLTLARIDDAGPPPRRPVDVAVLATAEADRYSAARVPVTVTTTATAPIDATPSALSRVLANILDNAVQHASTSVALTVGPAADGGALLTIADDGPGIRPADRERVFERFTRLEDARDRHAGGSGLGLAIAAELIAQQGGTITLADADPERDPPGLRVTVQLPGSRT